MVRLPEEFYQKRSHPPTFLSVDNLPITAASDTIQISKLIQEADRPLLLAKLPIQIEIRAN